MNMIMLVIDNPDLLDQVLDAWQAVGINGATIVESTGLHRRRATTLGARFAFGMPRVVERVEEGHYSIFVLVDTAEDVERCLRAAESVTGDLDAPHTGLFAAWPLAMVKGAWSPSTALQPDEGANEETPSSDAASLADGEDDDAGDNELEGAA
ncbi:MAG: hypothetical protein KDD78_07845 [Caldilineaceae bacterium]|nr:hypothetical protein [Caldilineaceae bacterium]